MGLVRRTTRQREDVPPAPALSALDSGDPEVRRRGALDLGARPDAMSALLRHLADESNAAARDAMLTVLAAQDSDAVARGLVTHLSSEDPALRTAVVDALATMTRAVPPLLPQLTTSSDPDVRILSTMLLASLAHPAVVPALEAMIATDPHANVVSAAIDALLPVATTRHIGLLEDVLARFPEDPFLQFTISGVIPRLEVGDR
jgi:HEAT repeat protein